MGLSLMKRGGAGLENRTMLFREGRAGSRMVFGNFEWLIWDVMGEVLDDLGSRV